jgi:hypothetical protein
MVEATIVCPHCRHEFVPWNLDTVPRDRPDHPCPFGVDVLAGSAPLTDTRGREIREWRFGNCPACLGPLETINGDLGLAVMMPLAREGSAT